MLPTSLNNIDFHLDSAGVVGFLGGEAAISAVAMVHVYEGKKWLGWYNSPGSYTVAKRLERLARSRLWNGLLSGICLDPATLFDFDGSKGPEYIATHSGTHIHDTGHTGYLFMKECEAVPQDQVTVVQGRTTTPLLVTITELGMVPEPEIRPTLQRPTSVLLACIPILSSLSACALCAVSGDWYCFSMILLGIVSNGVSCLVMGSGNLIFTHPKAAGGSPKADGIIKDDKKTMILLGEEGAVNSVTRGTFSLQFESGSPARNMTLCSLLLHLQAIAQLLLIPQGKLPGQIMFLMTFMVSWIYNSYLSSLDVEGIQRKTFMKMLGSPEIKQYKLPNRTSMAVFVLLVLRPRDPKKVLNDLLPNDTNTWKIWKQVVLNKLEKKTDLEFDASDYVGVEEGEKQLLETLFGDAKAAHKGYLGTGFV